MKETRIGDTVLRYPAAIDGEPSRAPREAR
jgi:hypothetical protein